MGCLSWKARMMRQFGENSGATGGLPQPVPGTKISHPSLHPVWLLCYQKEQRRNGGGKNKKPKILENFVKKHEGSRSWSVEVEKCCM